LPEYGQYNSLTQYDFGGYEINSVLRGIVAMIDLPDFDYSKIETKLTGFIKSELSKIGLNRVVLGVSGGVDSALTAFLSVKAIGAKDVVGVILPYKTSDPQNQDDAEELIKHLNIKRYHTDITPQIDAYFEKTPDADKTRRGNKMARERMSVLYDISAAERAVVIGTSNKTEIFLGYGTLHGDLACAFNPLGDLYKTQVRGLAGHLGVPQSIIKKRPSADLFQGQTDEGDFGYSYEEIDKLLMAIVDRGLSPEQCENDGFDPAMIRRVIQLMKQNEFKRDNPPIAKISNDSIGIDFRCPREWGI
jgi:NAD+ synthase